MARPRATHVGARRYFSDVNDPGRTIKAVRTRKGMTFYLREKKRGKWRRIFKEDFNAMWEAGEIRKRTSGPRS